MTYDICHVRCDTWHVTFDTWYISKALAHKDFKMPLKDSLFTHDIHKFKQDCNNSSMLRTYNTSLSPFVDHSSVTKWFSFSWHSLLENVYVKLYWAFCHSRFRLIVILNLESRQMIAIVANRNAWPLLFQDMLRTKLIFFVYL